MKTLRPHESPETGGRECCQHRGNEKGRFNAKQRPHSTDQQSGRNRGEPDEHVKPAEGGAALGRRGQIAHQRAFSPFGDITTLMVWQRGIVDFFTFFLPVISRSFRASIWAL